MAGAYACCHGTWMASILPYLEQSNLADLYVHEGKFQAPDDKRYSSPINHPVTTQIIPSLLCPSDDKDLKGFLITSHNYSVNLGNAGYVVSADMLMHRKPEVNGVVFRGAPFYIGGGYGSITRPETVRWPKFGKFKDIRDGLSQTLLASEVVKGKIIQGSGFWDYRGYTWYGFGATGFGTIIPPNGLQPDVAQREPHCGTHPDTPPCIGPHNGGRPMRWAARSFHPGGVNTARCDGSVAFVSENINLGTWQALGSSQGEEVIAEN